MTEHHPDEDSLVALARRAITTVTDKDYWYTDIARRVPEIGSYEAIHDSDGAVVGYRMPDHFRDHITFDVGEADDRHVLRLVQNELKYISHWAALDDYNGTHGYMRLVSAEDFLARGDAHKHSLHYGKIVTPELRAAMKSVVTEELRAMGISGAIEVDLRYTGELGPDDVDIFPDFDFSFSQAPKQMLEIKVRARALEPAMQEAGWIGR